MRPDLVHGSGSNNSDPNLQGIQYSLLLLLCFIVVACDTDGNLPSENSKSVISGDISENATWSVEDSPYMVTKQISISKDSTLKIDQGVEVYFNEDAGLVVYGALLVQGSQAMPVGFRLSPAMQGIGQWAGLRFENTNDAQSSLIFAEITYARTAVHCFSSHPRIIQCYLHDNGTALEAQESAPMILCCSIVNNEVGIRFASGHHNSVEVKDNRIVQNDIGVIASGTRLQLKLMSNDLSENRMALILDGPRDVDARSNWWGNTDANLLDPIIHDQHDDTQLGVVYFQPLLLQSPVFSCEPTITR